MLTFEDCLALCELTEEEVEAISGHEHVPEIVAAEYGNYLVHTASGQVRIRQIIVDDIARARSQGDLGQMSLLIGVLRHFIETHPKSRGYAT